MKTKTRALLALTASALVALMAAPAFAEGFCDSEEQECPSGPPSGPPPLPNLPAAHSVNGTYSVSLGSIQNSEFRQGYIQDGKTTYFGGGPFHNIGGDGSLTVGQTNNTVTLTPVLPPNNASVTVATVATTPQDPNFPGFDLVARGSLSLGYLVDLHANNQAAADALANLLSTNGAIANISGAYSLQATGSAWGGVSASTGITGLAQNLNGSFSAACSPISYFGTPGACHDGTYSLALNFMPGTAFIDGNPLDFYSVIGLSASSNSGPPDLGWEPGTMTASIDPTITFSSKLNLSNYSLQVGGQDAQLQGAGGGGVPEPAAWALMLVGFGGLGAMLRHRRQQVLAA